jgi:hypothetical protein
MTRQQVKPLLDAVEYDLNFVWNEATKDPPMPDVAGMLIAIFELTGILLVSCILGGVPFCRIVGSICGAGSTGSMVPRPRSPSSTWASIKPRFLVNLERFPHPGGRGRNSVANLDDCYIGP